jgi:hypothetical protein
VVSSRVWQPAAFARSSGSIDEKTPNAEPARSLVDDEVVICATGAVEKHPRDVEM